jgi:hypothetical protein
MDESLNPSVKLTCLHIIILYRILYRCNGANFSCRTFELQLAHDAQIAASCRQTLQHADHTRSHARNEANVQLCQPPLPKSHVRGVVGVRVWRRFSAITTIAVTIIVIVQIRSHDNVVTTGGEPNCTDFVSYANRPVRDITMSASVYAQSSYLFAVYCKDSIC